MPTLTIHTQDNQTHQLTVLAGSNLRQVLLDNDLPPYTRLTRRANCGGRGLCATCGVWIAPEEMSAPTHWHDKLANRFGYPRLSCQITVESDMTIYFVDKWIWGNRSTYAADVEQK